MERGPPLQREHAKQRVREIIATDPTFAYAQLLAERHKLWEGTTVRPTIFATAFERALRTNDTKAMADIAGRYPRWAALAVIARALMGDIGSAVQIKSLLGGLDQPLLQLRCFGRLSILLRLAWKSLIRSLPF
jgi:hypothetical protein